MITNLRLFPQEVYADAYMDACVCALPSPTAIRPQMLSNSLVLVLGKIPRKLPDLQGHEGQKYKIATVSLGLSLAAVDMWRAGEGRESKPPFVIRSLLQHDLRHWVSVPHMSHLTGSDAVAMEHVQLEQMKSFQLSSFQAGFTCWGCFGGKTGSVCL